MEAIKEGSTESGKMIMQFLLHMIVQHTHQVVSAWIHDVQMCLCAYPSLVSRPYPCFSMYTLKNLEGLHGVCVFYYVIMT